MLYVIESVEKEKTFWYLSDKSPFYYDIEITENIAKEIMKLQKIEKKKKEELKWKLKNRE